MAPASHPDNTRPCPPYLATRTLHPYKDKQDQDNAKILLMMMESALCTSEHTFVTKYLQHIFVSVHALHSIVLTSMKRI